MISSPHTPTPKPRRLTEDLVTSTSNEKPPVDHPDSWAAIFGRYSHIPRLDQEEFPDDLFNELPSPLSSTSPVSPSSESFPSSSDSRGQCIETDTIPHNLMTPLNTPRAAMGETLLGQTLELGNCTYELEHSNTTTVSKLDFQKQDFSISSTPLNNTTCDMPCIRSNNKLPRVSIANELFKSPSQSHRPYLAVKPAENTVDIEIDNELDVSVSPREPLPAKRPTPTCQKSTKIPPAPKHQSKLVKSTIPVMTRLGNRTAGTSSNKTLLRLRPASSTNSLSQNPTRTSLLPTSLKSRSHDRINAPTATRGFYFKK